MCSDRIGCLLSFPLAFPPSGDTHRCLGERDPASCRRVRGAAGETGTIETMGGKANSSGTSCFCQRPHRMGIDVNSIFHHINNEHQISGLSCISFQVNASGINSNKPLSPVLKHVRPGLRLRGRHKYLRRIIQRITSEPLLFSRQPSSH